MSMRLFTTVAASATALVLLACAAAGPAPAASSPASAPPKPEPKMCPMIYQPVCGVDGKTYANPCVATNAGVRPAHKGPC